MSMNREYTELEMEVVIFENEDVVTDSVNSIPTDTNQAQWIS